MAAKTYYYAYLNENDIAEQIFDMPAPITSTQYIEIPSHDETLIGKRYNRDTGAFETVTWYCYAILNAKDIVTEVVRYEQALPVVPDNMIVLAAYDQTLVGKWYNRATGAFTEPPIHVLAELSTDQINVGTQDQWLTDKLAALDAASNYTPKQVIAGFSNNEVYPQNRMTKHYTIPFDVLPERLPKCLHVQVDWGEKNYNKSDSVNLWLVRNGENTDLHALHKAGTLQYVEGSNTAPTFVNGRTQYTYIPQANLENSCLSMSMSTPKITVGGAEAFVAYSDENGYRSANVGNFKYTESGLEFDIKANYAEGTKLTTRFKLRAFAY